MSQISYLLILGTHIRWKSQNLDHLVPEYPPKSLARKYQHPSPGLGGFATRGGCACLGRAFQCNFSLGITWRFEHLSRQKLDFCVVRFTSRGCPKKLFSECCWSHSALVQSPVAAPLGHTSYLSFLLHRQDFRKPNFTPKKTTKITKNTKNVSEKVIYIRVSQKNQKSEFCYATNPSGFHRLDEPPKKISAL